MKHLYTYYYSITRHWDWIRDTFHNCWLLTKFFTLRQWLFHIKFKANATIKHFLQEDGCSFSLSPSKLTKTWRIYHHKWLRLSLTSQFLTPFWIIIPSKLFMPTWHTFPGGNRFCLACLGWNVVYINLPSWIHIFTPLNENIAGTPREQCWNNMRTLPDHLENIAGTPCNMIIAGTPWEQCRNNMRTVPGHHENSAGTPWKHCRNIIRILPEHHKNIAGTP